MDIEIGTFVKQERKRRGLTQQELASMSGVGLNFVYQLEKNKQTVQLETTNHVLKALGTRSVSNVILDLGQRLQ